MSERLFNFSAGPGTLPLSVLEELREELPVYRDAGASLIELSHRSSFYSEVAESARGSMRRLLGLGDEWHILFLQGGASMQFYQVPLNFLSAGRRAAYINTGNWSKKAIKESQLVGETYELASSADSSFDHVPSVDESRILDGTHYVHFTSNNTIYGTQYDAEPLSGGVPLVCDASSDFLGRTIDLDRYGLIYAGAQKNVGPAGVTIVLVRDDFLETRKNGLPTLLDYGTHAAKLFHTPPVFAVYLVEKVLRWLEAMGGVAKIEARNKARAQRLYDVLDSTALYSPVAKPGSRSSMNVCFRLSDESLDSALLESAQKAGVVNIKGYRTVGGFRASLYNALPDEGVDRLIDVLKAFAADKG